VTNNSIRRFRVGRNCYRTPVPALVTILASLRQTNVDCVSTLCVASKSRKMAKGGMYRISLALVAAGYAARMLQLDLESLIGTSQIPEVVLQADHFKPSEVDAVPTMIQPTQTKSIDLFTWNRTTIPGKCFYVEDVCRTSHRWFYRPSTEKHQPRLTLLKDHIDVRWMATAYRREYRFEHHEDGFNRTLHNRCVDSPVTNHVRPLSLAYVSSPEHLSLCLLLPPCT
jgi:hypothetical protein